MALLTRISGVCNLCKINRTFLTLPRLNPYYLTKPRESQIWASLQTRYASFFSSIFRRPSVEKLKEQDNIPDEYELIYRNKMDRYFLAGQIFTTVCACVVLISITASDMASTQVIMEWEGGADKVNNELFFFLTTFIGFCAVIQLYILRTPIRIYHLPQQKNYIMVLYRSIPFMTSHINYTMNQVKKMPPRGILPWNDSMYEIKKKKVILIDNFFRKPADFNIMLGYQKSSDEDEL